MAGILNIQINSLAGEKEINLGKIEYYIKKNTDKKLDLVVMPEFFSTNIDYHKTPEDKTGGETINFIQNLARKYSINIIAGTIARKFENKMYNTSFAINREGKIIAKYDKIHLYNYMGGNEGANITAGDKIVTANFDFAKVGMAICFDARYPLHFNKLIKENVDIIVLPACWIVPTEIYKDENSLKYAQDMWITLNRTRAYDNMVYYIVSNQTKECGNRLYAIGTSMIISPTAEILAKAENKECALYADIEIENVKYLKSLFPIADID